MSASGSKLSSGRREIIALALFALILADISGFGYATCLAFAALGLYLLLLVSRHRTSVLLPK